MYDLRDTIGVLSIWAASFTSYGTGVDCHDAPTVERDVGHRKRLENTSRRSMGRGWRRTGKDAGQTSSINRNTTGIYPDPNGIDQRSTHEVFPKTRVYSGSSLKPSSAGLGFISFFQYDLTQRGSLEGYAFTD